MIAGVGFPGSAWGDPTRENITKRMKDISESFNQSPRTKTLRAMGIGIFAGLLIVGLAHAGAATPAAGPSFGDDLKFLAAHQQLIVLKSADNNAQVVVIPSYQGRVMTSTATGDGGVSYGWINRELIASGQLRPHMNAFGGEDRFWLGPEGGPYALFFAPDAPAQSLQYWQTPAVVDSEAWKVESASRDTVTLSARAVLKNRRGSELDVAFSRTVRLLDRPEVQKIFGAVLPPDVSMVGYESDNLIRNAGTRSWTRETGLPSVWILGMFTPGAKATVVIPIQKALAAGGPPIRSDYFGAIPADRLRTVNKTVFLRADGQSRGKLGIPRAQATAFAGSWDPDRSILTIINYDLPAEAARLPYVDSRWIDMADPYAGDILNAYNDGAPAPGVAPLGPFYEIESSSPAAPLAPGGTMRHHHRTVHLQGSRAALDAIARTVLGVPLDTIETAFAKVAP